MRGRGGMVPPMNLRKIHPIRECPLCGTGNPKPYFEDKFRPYFQCTHCQLVFVPSSHWLGPEEEKAVYDLHVNDPGDEGYRRFLSRLTLPLLEKLDSRCRGLDFGCGPGPALAAMVEEGGHAMDLFDPVYFPRDLAEPYDFITATEVVEHFRHPAKEFNTLFALLKPGGWLGLMTKQVLDQRAFAQWHYIRDLTHICFYSPPTFEYLADRFNAHLTFVGKDVILMQRKN